MRKRTLLLFVLVLPIWAFSQDDNDDNNVVISNANSLFKFVKGNSSNPVQVKEKTTVTYLCNNYRSAVPVVEFYNDVETIDDVTIYVDDSKKHGIVPKYEYYSSEGVFYSDAHVCYFELPLVKKGSTSQVTFEKTTNDPRYFSNIYFATPLKIQQQEIKLIVPSWMEVEIREFNFAKYKVQKQVTEDGDDKIYSYTMQNLPAIKSESQSPGPTYYMPHILVLCKAATPKDEKIAYFSSLKEQYAWYRSLVNQIGNDEKAVREKAEEITKGITTPEAKVKALFQWVQDNVRYIAFENGIAGFKPEKAQEVMRKKYGDCKGMANLLTEMLKSINLDARRCWIGTRHIAYDYSTPSLCVDNHMICAWMNQGKPVFLDATEKYIGFGEIAERIQGRQVLIENGDKYLLEKVPVASNKQNASAEIRKLAVEGANLKGHIVQTWKGESKEWMLSNFHAIKMDKQDAALKGFLSENKTNFEISNLKIANITNYNEDLKVEYDVLWKDALTTFGKESYLDIDNRRTLENFKIDTVKRKLPYWLQYKDNVLLETELNIPAEQSVTLPEKLVITRPEYSFTAGYTSSAGKLLYKCEILINDTEIKPSQFSQWNKDIDLLTNFYNQQIIVTSKK